MVTAALAASSLLNVIIQNQVNVTNMVKSSSIVRKAIVRRACVACRENSVVPKRFVLNLTARSHFLLKAPAVQFVLQILSAKIADQVH